MDAIQNLNKALTYIEANLTGEIDFREIAKIACCSEHQFNRMFSFLSGVGLQETVDTTGGNFQPEIWGELEKADFLKKLEGIADTDFQGMLRVNANITANSRDYYMGAATTKEVPPEFTAYTVPTATWVVFKTSGPQPETLLETWERIYAEWLPSSGYELAEPIEFVRDLNLTSSSMENEIWIPVKRR